MLSRTRPSPLDPCRYGIGFASGLLNGLLVGAGIPYQRVHGGLLRGRDSHAPATQTQRPAQLACSMPGTRVQQLMSLGGVSLTPARPHPPAAATTWKGGMGLRKQGKEGSIALACHLLPAAAPLLQ